LVIGQWSLVIGSVVIGHWVIGHWVIVSAECQFE
jgi:hypothetical protein